MRLLHVETLNFEEFFDDNIPPYYILSHRWAERETSFKDFAKRKNTDSPGYRKIINFCDFVKRHRTRLMLQHDILRDRTRSRFQLQEPEVLQPVQWVWIDTCCIDKRSSAELSEAINSMFQWYLNSEACVVYLNDVSDGEHGPLSAWQALKTSAWFQRGWTLQELLAPQLRIFCDANWGIFGHVCGRQGAFRNDDETFCKHDLNICMTELSDIVSEITSIPMDCLRGSASALGRNVAVKMSWASRRKTSRLEDEAYCLFGLFKVNMPLLYGEGRKAFTRLQEEIMRTSGDQSIFAWMSDDQKTPVPKRYEGYATALKQAPLLASSPASFDLSGDVTEQSSFYSDNTVKVQAFALGILGLEMRVSMFPVMINKMEEFDTYFVYIRCSSAELSKFSNRAIGESDRYRLALIRLSDFSGEENRFGRFFVGDIRSVVLVKDPLPEQLICIDLGYDMPNLGVCAQRGRRAGKQRLSREGH